MAGGTTPSVASIRRICDEHIALLMCLGAFVLVFALPSMSIGFYADHGFRYPQTQTLKPNYDVRAFADFVDDNYRYLFVRLVSESDFAIHVNRMWWFLMSALGVYGVGYLFWGRSKVAGLLITSVYLSYPVLSSQRLWSLGFIYSMAVFFACLSMMFELEMLEKGFSLARRGLAFLFYFWSIYVIEVFSWLPAISVLVPVYRFVKGRDSRIDRSNVVSFVILYSPLIAWLYLWETRAGRKAVAGLIPSFWPLDLNALLQNFGIPVYQLISGNNGKGFASFLVEVATLVGDGRYVWEVFVALGWTVATCWLVRSGLGAARKSGVDVVPYVLLSVLWIGLSAVVVALGGMKGGSNGYIADRVNGGLSSGAAFMFSGLFMFGLHSRSRFRALGSFLLLGAFLFLLMFGGLLQLRDWRHLGIEEERIRASLKSSGLIGEVSSVSPILLSGVAHVLSSFPHKSNPNFSGDEVYSDYRFTPLSLHERWPDAGALSGRLGAMVYRVDVFHRVRCQDTVIVLERPIGVDERKSRTSHARDRHDETRTILGAVYVSKGRDGGFTARRVDGSNCSAVIPEEFRAL